jgi:GNAT superfamily N-acetyltransferase
MYRQEMNCQIRHDAHHGRGFTSIYLVRYQDSIAGYGCVGDSDTRGTEVVSEFYVTPPYRAQALPLFRSLLAHSGATRVSAQTNDRLLALLLYDCCRPDSITSDVILFEDSAVTALPAPPGVTVWRVPVEEPPTSLQHGREDAVAELDGETVGTGGFMCHYNPPYGDVYMEVVEAHRGKGIGSYLVQEIKRACYETGRRPSARCNATNVASRRTLQKAGFLPCARLLEGTVASTRA